MTKGVRSARGVLVDFNLLKIRNQIASAPKTTSVQAREDFIDQKFRRRLKRAKKDVSTSAQVSEIKKEKQPTVLEEPEVIDIIEENNDNIEE